MWSSELCFHTVMLLSKMYRIQFSLRCSRLNVNLGERVNYILLYLKKQAYEYSQELTEEGKAITNEYEAIISLLIESSHTYYTNSGIIPIPSMNTNNLCGSTNSIDNFSSYFTLSEQLNGHLSQLSYLLTSSRENKKSILKQTNTLFLSAVEKEYQKRLENDQNDYKIFLSMLSATTSNMKENMTELYNLTLNEMQKLEPPAIQNDGVLKTRKKSLKFDDNDDYYSSDNEDDNTPDEGNNAGNDGENKEDTDDVHINSSRDNKGKDIKANQTPSTPSPTCKINFDTSRLLDSTSMNDLRDMLSQHLGKKECILMFHLPPSLATIKNKMCISHSFITNSRNAGTTLQSNNLTGELFLLLLLICID